MLPKFFTSSSLALAALCVLTVGGLITATLSLQAAADPAANAPTTRPALTVSTTQPELHRFTDQLPANGNIAAWQEASISSESNGLRLTDVRVNVGDQVRAGQVLATFAPETVKAEVAQARASWFEAKAHAAEAEANAQRARTLIPSGALSQQQIQQYATAAQTAQARVEAAQAMLQVQQLRLKQTQVLAPDAGVISARNATVGAVVGAGSELFRMVRKGRLEWRAEVSSNALNQIQPGVRASLQTPNGSTVEGTVRMLAPTVDARTRNALVYVDLPPHPELRAGMFASGIFLLGKRKTLSLPIASVVVRDGFSHVFEVTDTQRVVMRRVQTGLRQGERVELVSGLPAQAVIVERGGAFLSDGDQVRVQAPAKQPATKPALSTVSSTPAS